MAATPPNMTSSYSNREGKGWGQHFFFRLTDLLSHQEGKSFPVVPSRFLFTSHWQPVVSAKIVKPVNHFLHDLWHSTMLPKALPAPKIILKCTSVLSLWMFQYFVCFVNFQVFKLSGIYCWVWIEITLLFSLRIFSDTNNFY